MNRRKFFGAIAAAVTAACVPGLSKTMEYRGSVTGRWSANKGPGFIASRYSSAHAWWRPRETFVHIQPQNFSKIEARTLAALQSAWKECLSYKTGDTLIIDEQAYEVFKTLQE